MKKFDRKTQMMDAGTALFETKDGYGTVLGQVKAELKEYGSVSSPEDYPMSAMPESTATYDLFLDYSTPWRIRYISCCVEDAGDTGRTSDIGEPIRRYAITFKEGNRSSLLRTLVYLLVVIAFVAGIFLSGQFYLTLLAIILGLFTLYGWMIPSKTAQKRVAEIIDQLNRYGAFPESQADSKS